LREGLPVVAATITVASPDVAAHAANLGFDFLWVEMEHSPITLETLRQIVLATRGLPAATFARVPVNELWPRRFHAQRLPFDFHLPVHARRAARFPPGVDWRQFVG
jgi:hypothetical protein